VAAIADLERRWNDLLAEAGDLMPGADAELAGLLAWALGESAAELGAPGALQARVVERAHVSVQHSGGWSLGGQPPQDLLVAVCNKNPQGGGLRLQIETLVAAARGRRPVAVRSSELRSKKGSSTAKLLDELRDKGGAWHVTEEADWRTMAALRQFRQQLKAEPLYELWLREVRPLTRLPALRAILRLDALQPPQPSSSTATLPPRPPQPVLPTASAPVAEQPAPPPEPLSPAPTEQPSQPSGPELSFTAEPWPERGAIQLGETLGRLVQPFDIEPQELTRHAAFLGGSGSGKTTAALALVESLLLRGVPVILVDRKGDLCSYARPEAWSAPLPDPAQEQRRQALRARVDVALYTPGNPAGRPLAISVVPQGLREMEPHERDAAAGTAADALASIMGMSHGARDRTKRAILKLAIEVLGMTQDRPVLLEDLIQLLDECDGHLVQKLGLLDVKNIPKLAQELETLRVTKGMLLGSGDETLDADTLLGKDTALQGRVRLSIVSTRFLGPLTDVEFWVAQLLLEMGRWLGRNPASEGRLQAALLLDEADLYLPATRQPATKAPLENLLKRARSAGLCVLLATQSPGDLDYKGRENVRTWLVGAVKEERALLKLAWMFPHGRADGAKLAAQRPGEVYVAADGTLRQVRLRRNLVPPLQVPEEQIQALARR
jgi:hypothetical protein